MKKNILFSLMIVSVAALLTGCGESKKEAAPAVEQQAAPAPATENNETGKELATPAKEEGKELSHGA